jgi:2-iminobutanoate/2-iminopropanoate deaminase
MSLVTISARCAVESSQAPAPIGPYSQAIAAQGAFVFASGQIGVDPESGEMVDLDVSSQTRQALRNLAAVLEAGGTALDHVVKTTVFLADMDDFVVVNQVYAEFFQMGAPPARSCVQVARLPKHARVGIEAIAWHPGSAAL